APRGLPVPAQGALPHSSAGKVGVTPQLANSSALTPGFCPGLPFAPPPPLTSPVLDRRRLLARQPAGHRRENPSPRPPPRPGEGEKGSGWPGEGFLSPRFALRSPPLRFGEGAGGRGS